MKALFTTIGNMLDAAAIAINGAARVTVKSTSVIEDVVDIAKVTTLGTVNETLKDNGLTRQDLEDAYLRNMTVYSLKPKSSATTQPKPEASETVSI